MCKDLQELKFGEIHCHSAYSDSISSIESNVFRAKELDMDALAITDHGTCAGLIEHWKSCNEHDIIPILSTEGYIRLPETLDLPSRNSASGRYHITLISTSITGYTNLIALNNASHVNREKVRGRYFPIITFDMLREMDLTDVVVASGCPASITYHDNFDVADEYIRFLVQQFGKDNVYAELMEHVITRDADGTEFNCWSRPSELAKKHDIQTIWSGDVHAATPEDLDHLKILQKATAFEYTVNALKSKQETYDIATKCVGESAALEAMIGVDKLINTVEPVQLEVDFELPECEELIDYVKDKILKAFEKDLEKYSYELGEDVLRNRLQTEWNLNDRWNFWSYFAIVNDLVEFAHTNNVSTTARGSGGGSYILYLLEITQLNPIKHGLYFERFLCEKRFGKGELPDIDLDFASNKRHLIQEYAFEKWGLLGVCTYLTYSHKSLIRFLGRTWGKIRGYEMDSNTISKATQYDAYEYDSDGKVIGKTESFEKFCAYASFLEPMYNSMLDTISGTGTHACALAIVNGQIALPVEGFTDSLTIAYVESGSNKSLQLAGRVKIDALGLRALAQLDMMQKMIAQKIPVEIMDGDPCFSLYNNGATGGLFQFDTGVSRSIVEKNKGFINSIHDLSRMTAKGRPGAMSQGLHMVTPDKPVDVSNHPGFIQDILSPTYGVCCYQEQVMEIYASMAYGELNSDTLQDGVVALKTLVPKNVSVTKQPWYIEKKNELRDEVVDGAINHHGLDKQYAEEFFDSLSGFARYGFNLPHSLLYANLSTRMAWVKYNYPKEFWTIVLNSTNKSDKHDPDKIRYFVEATRFGNIAITPPTINTVKDEYTLNKELNQVQMPLTVIDKFGPKIVSNIVNERNENGLFKSLKDFNERCKVPKNRKKTLYECGVFDDLKTDNPEQDLIDLGIREVKDFTVRGDKWEAENIIEIELMSTISDENGITALCDTLGGQWTIDTKTKTKTRAGLLNGVTMLLIVDEDNSVIEFKKKSYIEEMPELNLRVKAIRDAYGFSWSNELIRYYEYAESKPLEKFFGFVTEIEEERKTKATTQFSIKLETGKRIWWLKQDRTKNNWLTKKGLVACQEAGVNYISPSEIPDLKLGDVIGGTLFTTTDKETGEPMTFGQVMSYKKFG